MNHQPFETWILEGSPLSGSQDKELREHLLTCPKCGRLHASLREAERHIRTMPVKSPRAGFTNRWKELAVERQARALEEQSRRFLYGILATAGVVLVVTVVYTLLNGSPMNWIIDLVESGVEALVKLQMLQHTVATWIRIVPLPIQLVIWVPIATIFGFLGLTWLIALWRIPTRGAQVS